MDGLRRTVDGAGGVEIGLLTAGSGPALLLVHGGMGTMDNWALLWDALTARFTVTAMDRRGRGSSGDEVSSSAATCSASVSSRLMSWSGIGPGGCQPGAASSGVPATRPSGG